MKNSRLSRRDFLYLSLGGGVVIVGYPLAHVVSQLRTPKGDRTFPPTPSNTLGPFYKEGAPRKTRLIDANDPGVPLLVTGRVFNTSGEPLTKARIEVFHADHYGDYDLEGFRYRGEIPVGPAGEYKFESIMPGHYSGRVQHVHYVITAPQHKQLVTQLYFETDPRFAGDPDKNFRSDGLVQHRELIRPVKTVPQNNVVHTSVVFDICLEKG